MTGKGMGSAEEGWPNIMPSPPKWWLGHAPGGGQMQGTGVHDGRFHSSFFHTSMQKDHQSSKRSIRCAILYPATTMPPNNVKRAESTEEEGPLRNLNIHPRRTRNSKGESMNSPLYSASALHLFISLLAASSLSTLMDKNMHVV